MSEITSAIVSKVWGMCNPLRDDGVSYGDYLEQLKNSRSRAKMAKKFNIPMDGYLFDTTQPGTADKIVKLLCNRGMVDPFDDNPMEVAGSKKWE